MDTTLFIIVLVLILFNIVSLWLFRADKKKSERNEWRTSENTLLISALLGPFGALVGMTRYRHKTKKLKFKLVPLFAMLHVLIFVYILLRLIW